MSKNCTSNILLLILIFCWQLQAQEWTRKLDGPPTPNSLPWISPNFVGNDVEQTNDGGYVLAGLQTYPTSTVRNYPSLTKVDAQGFTVWQKTYLIDTFSVLGFSNIELLEMPNGNLLFAGLNQNKIHLIQTSALGDTIWTRKYDSYCLQTTSINCIADHLSLEATLDGNYILAVGSHFISNTYQTQLIKLNPNGGVLWDKVHFNTWAEDIEATFDGGYVLAGHDGLNLPMLYKVDLDGDSLWLQTYTGIPTNSFHSVAQAPDSGFAVATALQGATVTALLMKIDATGSNVLWSLTPSTVLGGTSSVANHIEYDSNGYFIATGNVYKSHPLLAVMLDVATITKLDLAGNLLHTQTFEDEINNKGNVVRPTSDGGYIMAGEYANHKAYLIKTDSMLNRPIHRFQGYVYKDDNYSCIRDTNEIGFVGWVVQLKKSDGTSYYGSTDSTGYYDIIADTGTFLLNVLVPNNLWGFCTDSIMITSSQLEDADTLDFGVRAIVNCPSLNVDVSTALLRRCSTAVYTVSYCNQGTTDATNASVNLTFDTTLTVVNSSISFSVISGGMSPYVFNLGTIGAGVCGSFSVTVQVSCFSQLGETHCVEARISPDSLCGNTNDEWDGSDIDVEGVCYGDSIVYMIRNIGVGDMQATRQYFVTEDHVVLLVRNFNLTAGDSLRVHIPTANGAVYRLEAKQDENHPYSDYSSLGVAMCVAYGLTANLNAFTGTLGQFVEDDGSPRISIDCQQNIGSWDPNDKRAAPTGYGETHAIEANTDLEYHIRFQNTGTDTAFNVIVFDTLSEFLDASSIVPGASSHPYTWKLKNNGIVVFTFNNILLPDSITNEPASHGFIKFKIKQALDLPLGSIINNTAAIVFDMNAPIITNQTYHTIDEDFIVDIITIIDRPEITIDVYPNPFDKQATVVVEGETFFKLELRMVDAMGREVQRQQTTNTEKITVQRNNLVSGVYFMQLIGDGVLIGTGKIIVR